MTSPILDFRTAIAALLIGDATFSAAVNALLGQTVSTVLNSNMPTTEIPSGMYPCWVVELGDGQSASISNNETVAQTIGLSQQTFTNDLYVVLVWGEQDREKAAQARATLPVLLTQLLLRNPMPGGIDGAAVTAFQPDRGTNHPMQIWRATISGDLTFTRA